MIFKRFLTGGLFAAAAFAAAAGAAAQEQTQTDPGAAAREMTQNAAKPADGEMIALNVANMWTISQMSDVKLSDIQIVTTQAKFPSISPDGQKILLFAPETDAAPRKLLRWTPKTDELQELMSGQNVSMFVTWDDADNISMRQADKPFFGDSRLLKLRLENKSAALRAKKPLADSKLFAYDDDDIIILARKDTKTLQAISDVNADRYYAPIVSPDEKFVVFSGLTTGVHIFDVEKNAVVYIGAKGTDPSFSPDGRYLIYGETSDDGNDYTSGNLIIVDLQKHSRRALANPSKEIRLRGTLSKDASFVAYETAKGAVYRARLAAGE